MKRVFASLPVALLFAACSLLGGDAADDETLFLVQAEPQTVVMQALYQGKVVRKGECLRLDRLPEGHSVVWPYGFHLGGPNGDVVLDQTGRAIGLIGGTFRLGGGEVNTLWENGPVTDFVRMQALSRCPGEYWLVGEVN